MTVKEKKKKLAELKVKRSSDMCKKDELLSHTLDNEIVSLELEIQDDINHYKAKIRRTRSR